VCDCGFLGPACTPGNVRTLDGDSGTVTGDTRGAPTFYGDGGAGDALFSVYVPPGTELLILDTCVPGTDFDTSLTVVATCFHGPGSLLSALGVLADNDDASATAACSRIDLRQPPAGARLYAKLDGFMGAAGVFAMQYRLMDAAAVAASGAGPTATAGGGGLWAAGALAAAAAAGTTAMAAMAATQTIM
jgi:hypothetical protein